MKKLPLNFKGFTITCLISLAILAVWYASEYRQFGELQWNRQCDEIIYWLYFVALWIGFSR